jgi:hypothetical protein
MDSMDGEFGESGPGGCPQTRIHQSESRTGWLNRTFYGVPATTDPKNQAVPDLQNLKSSALCTPFSPVKPPK